MSECGDFSRSPALKDTLWCVTHKGSTVLECLQHKDALLASHSSARSEISSRDAEAVSAVEGATRTENRAEEILPVCTCKGVGANQRPYGLCAVHGRKP